MIMLWSNNPLLSFFLSFFLSLFLSFSHFLFLFNLLFVDDYQAMFRLGESDYILIKQQQQQQQQQQDQTTHTNDINNPTTLSKEDREAALSLFRKAKLWGIHVSLPTEQLENLQREVQGKGPGLAGKGQGLGGLSTAVHEVCLLFF